VRCRSLSGFRQPPSPRKASDWRSGAFEAMDESAESIPLAGSFCYPGRDALAPVPKKCEAVLGRERALNSKREADDVTLFSFRSPRALGLAAAGAAFLLDQAHKFWMLDVVGVADRGPIRLAPFLDVTLSWNRGISYSMLSEQGDVVRYGLLSLQLFIVAGLCAWLWRTPRRVTALALGLIVGGALGNAADRLRHGAVADFFFLHTSLPVGPLANYVFNVADALITLGVALMLIDAIGGSEGRADA